MHKKQNALKTKMCANMGGGFLKACSLVGCVGCCRLYILRQCHRERNKVEWEDLLQCCVRLIGLF